MKEKIESLLRHALTALPAVGGFFVGKGWLTGEEGAALDAALTDFLSVLFAIAAAALARVVMWLVAKYFPSLSGLLGGTSGGISPALLLMCTAAAFTVVALPSCSQAQLAAFKEIPVTVGIEGEHGTYSYNHETGLGVIVKVREEKSAGWGAELFERTTEDTEYTELFQRAFDFAGSGSPMSCRPLHERATPLPCD